MAQLSTLGSMSASHTSGTAGAVIAVSIAGFILLSLLIWSYKAGKIIKQRVRFGESPFYDRKDDPSGFWYAFIILSLVDAFIFGCAIWIAIHGV